MGDRQLRGAPTTLKRDVHHQKVAVTGRHQGQLQEVARTRLRVLEAGEMRLLGLPRDLDYAAFAPSPKGGYKTRCRKCDADLRARGRHGLTARDKYDLAVEQDGCAICARLDPGAAGWYVDHDRACCSGDRSCRLSACGRLPLVQHGTRLRGRRMVTLRRMADYLELGTRIAPPNRSTESVPTDPTGRNETDELTNASLSSSINPHVSERARGTDISPSLEQPALTRRASGVST